jgi:hypothetical protein
MSWVPGASLEAIVERARARSGSPAGPAPTEDERALLDALESHASAEAETLQAYQDLAERTPDEHVRYLARLILDDERRHHTILAEMVNRVRADTEWRDSVEPATPYLGQMHDGAMRETFTRLIGSERDDLHRVRTLKRRLRRRRATSLLWLMADMLECDTRKHLRVLKFLRRGAG